MFPASVRKMEEVCAGGRLPSYVVHQESISFLRGLAEAPVFAYSDCLPGSTSLANQLISLSFLPRKWHTATSATAIFSRKQTWSVQLPLFTLFFLYRDSFNYETLVTRWSLCQNQAARSLLMFIFMYEAPTFYIHFFIIPPRTHPVSFHPVPETSGKLATWWCAKEMKRTTQ